MEANLSYEGLREVGCSSRAITYRPGSAIDQAWIDAAEKALGFPLPDSYKWWLREFGDTSIGGQDLLTLAPREFREDADSDLVYVRKVDLAAGIKPSSRLYFFRPSLEEAFAFDLNSYINGEYLVVKECALGGGEEVYSCSFAEFLEKQDAEYRGLYR